MSVWVKTEWIAILITIIEKFEHVFMTLNDHERLLGVKAIVEFLVSDIRWRKDTSLNILFRNKLKEFERNVNINDALYFRSVYNYLFAPLCKSVTYKNTLCKRLASTGCCCCKQHNLRNITLRNILEEYILSDITHIIVDYI